MQSNAMAKETSPTSENKRHPKEVVLSWEPVKLFPGRCCSCPVAPVHRQAQKGHSQLTKSPPVFIPPHLRAGTSPFSISPAGLEKSQNSATAAVFLGKAKESSSTLQTSASI